MKSFKNKTNKQQTKATNQTNKKTKKSGGFKKERLGLEKEPACLWLGTDYEPKFS